MPNATVLINTLALREAQQSSEIENIFTTQDCLYKNTIVEDIKDQNTKEVINYSDAIKEGFRVGEVRIATTGGDLVYLPPADIYYTLSV